MTDLDLVIICTALAWALALVIGTAIRNRSIVDYKTRATNRRVIPWPPPPPPPAGFERIQPPTRPAPPRTPRPIDVAICPACVARLTEDDWLNLLEPGMESFLPDWLLQYSDVGWDASREMTADAIALADHARRCLASDDVDLSTPLGAAIAKFKEIEVAS